MKVFTYSEARHRLAALLDAARDEEILIRRRGGEMFSLRRKTPTGSPFDVPGIETQATTKDILDAVRESRAERGGEEEKRSGVDFGSQVT